MCVLEPTLTKWDHAVALLSPAGCSKEHALLTTVPTHCTVSFRLVSLCKSEDPHGPVADEAKVSIHRQPKRRSSCPARARALAIQHDTTDTEHHIDRHMCAPIAGGPSRTCSLSSQ